MSDLFPRTETSLDCKKKSGRLVYVRGEPQPSKLSRVVEKIDHDRANKLRDFVRLQKWLVRHGAEYWEEAFALLRLNLEKDDQIDCILDWYVEWFRPGKRPEIRSGSDLKRLWHWVIGLHEEWGKPATPISDVARRILKSLQRKESEDRLLAAIQKSLNNYTAFRKKLLSIWNRRDAAAIEEQRTDLLAIRLKLLLFRDGLPDATEFVESWFRAILERRPDFDGNWNRFVISDVNDRFMGRVRGYLGEFANEIFKEIGA